MAQGGSQPTNNGVANGASNTNNNSTTDHSRKPSVVINASGASGNYPNGGPVSQNGNRPAISFGSMNAQGGEQAGTPGQSQSASLQQPRQQDPRMSSPAHSPSPIPQPAASGGRPPSSLPAQNNGGLAFGSLPADTETMRGHSHIAPVHERRPSSHSMQSELSNQGMRPAFPPQGRGSGRGQFTPGQQYMGSPGAQYRNLSGQPPRNQFPQSFNPQQAPGSPYGRPAARASPVPMNAQPHMQGQQMNYQQHGYQMHPQQQQQMYGMPQYDAQGGYYNYYPPQYYGQPPQSPRPGYPSPFQGGASGMQPPFHPSAAPGMARTPSQASERPASSMSHPQTPAQSAPVPSGTPIQNPATPVQSSSFVRPVKKSNAIKITDANGNAIDFTKPSTPAQSSSQGPVIVSTPNAPTPPPRAGSNNHNRAESKSAQSTEAAKNAFAEQIKRKLAEDKRLEEEAAAAKSKDASDKAAENKKAEDAAASQIKQAAAEAEKAAAKAAADKKAEEDAEAAKKAAAADEDEKTRKQKEEDERLEREIEEMEAQYAAQEKEEQEREAAYQAKKAKEKAEKEAKAKANLDDELKRAEREAEAREEAREREREAAGKKSDADEEAKSMFAQLKKTTLGPQGSAAETPSAPVSEKDDDEPAEPSLSAAPRAGAQKPKPAHLKLETNKPVERPEPTPGMQALKSSRFLEIKEEAKYPDGFKSPNPALNASAGSRKGHAYDKAFLLQFQNVFKEKPSVDWDQKVKDTLGPSDDSARTPARTPSNMGSRQGSRGGQPFGGPMGGPMGSFAGPMGTGNARGTTSEQRFQAAQMGGMGRPGMPAGRAPSQLGVGMGQSGVGMSRTNSSLQMGSMNSPRQQSSRGGRGGSRNDRQHSKRQEQADASKMPLTAHMEIKPIEVTQSGWKPMSLVGGQQQAAGPDPSGLMAPDMVQRKVKAALNKMTPEKFDKISDQILEIAAQSKHETDGRTLRQVIQLTFEKACDESHWAGMYAKFCQKMLTTMSAEIRDETIKDKTGNPVVGGALFRKYLLNRCQEEFERGWQANLPDKPEGESQEAALLSDEYYIAAAAKRRGLGLIQFIGQLYKLRMLTLRIMHECIMRLLNFEGDPDEAAIENLTTLLKSVGSTMDEEEQGQLLMKTYFERIDSAIMQNKALPSRPRFMILDLIDLRKAGWKGKDAAKGPKTIQEIHDEAAVAQAKAEAERAKGPRGGPPGGRMPAGRGDARNFSGNMPPPQDYNRTNVAADDLRRLHARGSNPRSGGSLGPGGSLGGGLGPRTGSRRGAGLGPGSAGTSRTNTPPVGDKKEEPATAQNAFSALAALDASGDQPEEAQSEAASPPAARNRSKSPSAAEKDETTV